jgi:DNA-directed RNA polymerase specialized sigma24 family protein
MNFCDLEGKEAEAELEPVDPYRSLHLLDRALMGMVERLGYSVPQAAEVLGISSTVAHRKYWQARQRLRPKKLLRDELLDRSPGLLPRDYLAIELVEVLGLSIGRAAKVIGINKGHLCRRIAIAKAIIQEAGDPRRNETT